MSKRFTSTEIWLEDWFIDLPTEYKLFWFYILSKCDKAGFFKINVKLFFSCVGIEIDTETALGLFNKGKKRIRKVNDGLWLIEDFFSFQYGQKFNHSNKMHMDIGKIYTTYGIDLKTISRVEHTNNGSIDRV